ncbi:unnamed protein product [Rotaria magnacalcarata]|uniref:Uncharacterized protein n=1 Tax=Rotaria magnacalcarata TaxID=392030 RepID=A0A816GKR1_9BILA|nr:unnamed protein product [Rotaria magnacalcarata]CAF2090365.1 unnamed protein product [Rotaria magnacalcarata]CAF2107442.1 unnamed protein product [Rotaria magnacalcarata]
MPYQNLLNKLEKIIPYYEKLLMFILICIIIVISTVFRSLWSSVSDGLLPIKFIRTSKYLKLKRRMLKSAMYYRMGFILTLHIQYVEYSCI